VITFNSGGLWSRIRGPTQDEEGRNITDCQLIDNDPNSCSLHLAQQLSKKFPATRSIPILSSSSAVGVIIGTGNVGSSLKTRSNVFLSADAGVSWHQVKLFFFQTKFSLFFFIGQSCKRIFVFIFKRPLFYFDVSSKSYICLDLNPPPSELLYQRLWQLDHIECCESFNTII